MAKFPSPLLGFNNNVRHKGRVFHIQTEDSGIRHPHIITHLFADGGRILKSTKTSYAEHLGQDALAETVRAMMQEQHKAMFMALRDGQFDHLFDDSAGPQSTRASHDPPAHPASGPKPRAGEAGAAAAAKIPAAAPSAPAAAPPPAAPPSASAPVAPAAAAPPSPRVPEPVAPRAPTLPAVTVPAPVVAQAPSPPPPAPPEASAPAAPHKPATRPRLDLDPAAIHARDPGPSPHAVAVGAPALERTGGKRTRSEPSIDLDLDALERAASEANNPVLQQVQDLPPPPAAVLGRRPSAGSYSVHAPRPAGAPPSPPAPRPIAPPAAPAASGQAGGRYAPSRPASIFATTRPHEGASIFGEDLISEKSLDEVILSYLAEDLEGPPEKK